jgi:two-component system, OmpR family, sensor kinase
MRAPALLRRQPIRIKLTLAYGGVVALVLAGLGIFVYFSFQSGLDADINQALRARADDLQTLIAQGGTPAAPGPAEGQTDLRQILDRGGRVLRTSPGLTESLLRRSEIAEAERHPIFRDRRERVRVFARRLRRGSSSLVVVGTSLEQREHAIERLGGILLAGGALALLGATLIGYGLASGAIRPADAMRRRAASISTIDPHARLPLPEAQDEIHALGTTINAMLDRLEHAAQRERDFIADASHELRTPLAILQTEIEVALRNQRTNAELRSALAVAGEETERLARLADDLLVLERADRDDLELNRERLSIGELLEQVAARFASHAAAQGRAIDVDVAEETSIEGDRDTLQRAVGSMLDNALRHGRGPIALLARRSDTAVEIHVLDAGSGFRPEFLGRAFDRFARADPTRTTSGAGLGLAIVRSIARAHGGDASASNRSDRSGADVWMTLPALRSSPSFHPDGEHLEQTNGSR